MNNTLRIIIYILCFLVGFLFSQAYLTGPKKHYKRGYEAAKQEFIK